MNPKYTHDFSSASIKHLIEAEFYQIVGEKLTQKVKSATIVSGPDYQRHIDNYRNYIDKLGPLRICEIEPTIYTDIFRGCINLKNVKVVNKSIDLFGSTFVDCDLTCTSNLEVIKNSLLKQIDIQSTSASNKAFIFSFGLRTVNPKTIDCYLRPIFGVLGSIVTKTTIDETSRLKCSGFGKFAYRITLSKTQGRIKDYICYSYNAGGGPMLTCLLIYK